MNGNRATLYCTITAQCAVRIPNLRQTLVSRSQTTNPEISMTVDLSKLRLQHFFILVSCDPHCEFYNNQN